GHVATQIRVHDVADTDEVFEDRSSAGRPEIQSEAALVAVEGLEEEAVLTFLRRRDVAADVAPGRRVLDLDDIGAKVGELHAPARSGSVLLDGDNAQVLERPHTGMRSRAATSAATRAISLPTIIIPSSTPIPGLASTCAAPHAMAICADTCADRSVSLQLPPQYADRPPRETRSSASMVLFTPPRSGVLTWMTSAACASTKSSMSSSVLHHSSTAIRTL